MKAACRTRHNCFDLCFLVTSSVEGEKTNEQEMDKCGWLKKLKVATSHDTFT